MVKTATRTLNFVGYRGSSEEPTSHPAIGATMPLVRALRARVSWAAILFCVPIVLAGCSESPTSGNGWSSTSPTETPTVTTRPDLWQYSFAFEVMYLVESGRAGVAYPTSECIGYRFEIPPEVGRIVAEISEDSAPPPSNAYVYVVDPEGQTEDWASSSVPVDQAIARDPRPGGWTVEARPGEGAAFNGTISVEIVGFEVTGREHQNVEDSATCLPP